MQLVSAQERAALERRREELFKLKIEIQDRITKAAALGDLRENSEYHAAKDDNRQLEKDLHELEHKIKNTAVVSSDDVPTGMVFLGHTVKLLDLDDDSEQFIKLVGEAVPPSGGDVLPVSVSSPMGEALFKSRVGDTVKVKAPRGTLMFKVLEIVT